MALYAGLAIHLVDSRAVPSVQAVSSKLTNCELTSDNVNFHDLIETFSAFYTNDPHMSLKRAIFQLQMFTPIPLHHMACFANGSSLCNSLASTSIQELTDKKFTLIWKDLYLPSGSQQNESEKPSNKMGGKHSAKCTTDFSRFPPVLCEATCRSSCDCCRQRTPEENGGHHIKKRVHVMQIKSCHNGTATWELKDKILLPISPNSCVCTR